MSQLNGVTRWMIHAAAQRTPQELADRMEEEWLADAISQSASWQRWVFALNCCWAALVISRDAAHRSQQMAAVVVSGRNDSYADRGAGYVCLRSGTLFLILGIHAALFCGLMTTL